MNKMLRLYEEKTATKKDIYRPKTYKCLTTPTFQFKFHIAHCKFTFTIYTYAIQSIIITIAIALST